MRPLVAVLALVLAASPLAQDRRADSAQGAPLPDFNAFAAQVRKNLATDEERQSSYTYTERRTEQKVDSSGRPTSESVKVYEVYPSLPGERRYRRLIEEDGRRIAPDQIARKDRDRQEHVDKYVKALESEAQRQKAAREREKEQRRMSAAIEDIFRIYDIRMI